MKYVLLKPSRLRSTHCEDPRVPTFLCRVSASGLSSSRNVSNADRVAITGYLTALKKVKVPPNHKIYNYYQIVAACGATRSAPHTRDVTKIINTYAASVSGNHHNHITLG